EDEDEAIRARARGTLFERAFEFPTEALEAVSHELDRRAEPGFSEAVFVAWRMGPAAEPVLPHLMAALRTRAVRRGPAQPEPLVIGRLRAMPVSEEVAIGRVAPGSAEASEALESLVRAAGHDDPLVRTHAV